MSVYGVEDGFPVESKNIGVGVTSGDKIYMKQALSTNPNVPYTSLLATVVLPTENSGIADVELRLTGTLDIFANAAINAGGTNFTADIFAVHDPLGSIIDSIIVTTGGQSFSKTNTYIVQQALDRYFKRGDHIKDTLQTSQTLTNVAAYGNTFTGEQVQKAITSISVPGAGASQTQRVTVNYDIVGKLPFDLFKEAIYGLNTFNIQITFTSMSNLFRLIALGTGATIPFTLYSGANNTTGNITAALYYTAVVSKATLPKQLYYRYMDLQITQGSSAPVTLAAGATAVLNSQTITSSSIPTGYLIFATTGSVAIPEVTMLAITSINVNFMNKSSLLTNADQYQLYTICKKNGFKYSFPYFSGQTFKNEIVAAAGAAIAANTYSCQMNGNPIYLTPEDMNIDPKMCSGMSAQCQFSCTATVQNGSLIGTGADVVLYVVPVFMEQLVVSGNSCSRNRAYVKEVPTQVVKGGSFLEDLAGTVGDIFTFNVPGLAKRLSGGSTKLF
jgi:hypothetical protein